MSRILPDEGEEGDSPSPSRTRRGNAELTYRTVARIEETVSSLSSRVEVMLAKYEGTVAKAVAQEKEHQALEARVRVLELTITAMQAVSTSSSDRNKLVWPLIVSSVAAIASAVNVFVTHFIK